MIPEPVTPKSLAPESLTLEPMSSSAAETSAPPFIHLRVHTAHSLSEGAIRIQNLLDYAQEHRVPALAVTDRANLFCALEFAEKARSAGLQPITGLVLPLVYGEIEAPQLLISLSRQGYETLMALVSEAYLGQPDGRPRLALERLLADNSGLLAFVGAPDSFLAQRLRVNDQDSAAAHLSVMRRAFDDRLLVELQRHGRPEEDAIEEALVNLAYDHGLPLVASNDAHFLTRGDFEAQDVLACIAQGKTLQEANRDQLTPEHWLKPPDAMAERFADLPEAIQNPAYVAERCAYAPERHAPILPHFPSPRGLSEAEELKTQAEAGLEARLQRYVYPESSDAKAREALAAPYYSRLAQELEIISSMGFPGYFLIVADFIQWAKAQGIPVGPGRGSGAGSLVAYALQITDLDPLTWGLLFERFLNPERVSMPDFDIDFCQDRRDEVIAFVQQRYGADRVASIITFGSLKARAALRDVGRVMALPYGQVDRLCKLVPFNPAAPNNKLRQAIADEPILQTAEREDPEVAQLFAISEKLEGLYRHASTHAAGVVISDRPLQELVPLYQDPRATLPATQFDMKWVEQAGLVKFDFLGLKTLTVLDQARRIAAEMGQDFDYDRLPLDDQALFERLCEADTVGIFQLESAGMRDTMKALKPHRISDIVALVSLYRPGPMDNIPLFIERKHGTRNIDYMHPKLEPILKETYGVMVYQEQVMQAAQVLAGYTLGGADLLRRAMGKKIKAEMDQQRETFVAGCARESQIARPQALAIFKQIEAFAGYGFNKSHAAAYALIAYQTAWVKTHRPLAFYVASMNLDRSYANKLAVFRQDMGRHGITLLPPDVNRSNALFSVEGSAVRYGLAALKGAGEALMQAIVDERARGGTYQTLKDFLKRIADLGLNKRQLEVLIEGGALDSFNADRSQLYESVEAMLHYASAFKSRDASGMDSLFASEQTPDVPLTLAAAEPWSLEEKLEREQAVIGFYLSEHPLAERWPALEASGHIYFRDLLARAGQTAERAKLTGILTKVRRRKSARGQPYAFLSLSDPSASYEVTLFAELLAQRGDLLEPGALLSLDVSARSDSTQGVKLTAQAIRSLDASLESSTERIRIHCQEPGQIDEVAELLRNLPSGRACVELHLPLEKGGDAALLLPQRLRADSKLHGAFRTIKGVRLEMS